MTRTEAQQILGIATAEFTDEQLRKAYRLAAKKAHPDVGGTAQQMMLVTEAYKFLSDPNNLKARRMTVTHSGILDVVVC